MHRGDKNPSLHSFPTRIDVFRTNSNRTFVFILPVDFGIALATHFSSSSTVLAGINLFSAISVIWLVKQRVCFELTNNKTEKRCIKCKIISHTSTSATESQSTPQSVDYDRQKEYLRKLIKMTTASNSFVGEVISKTRASGFNRFSNTRKQ